MMAGSFGQPFRLMVGIRHQKGLLILAVWLAVWLGLLANGAAQAHDHALDDATGAAQARLLNEPLFAMVETEAVAMSALEAMGQWGPVTTWPFVFASAANLPDGRIAAWGGNRPTTASGGFDTYTGVWDPVTGQITEQLYDQHAMFCGIATLRENGQIFVAGGDGESRALTSLFDYGTNSWQRIDDAHVGRWYNGALHLPTGQVFMALGSTGSRYPELWTEGVGWRWLTGIDLQAPILDYVAEYGRPDWFPLFTVAPSGDILHVGPTPKMHYINPQGNGSIQEAGAGIIGWDANNQAGTMMMYAKGKVLTFGGEPNQRKSSIVDLNAVPPQVTSTTGMLQPRSFANAVMMPNGEAFAVGGNTSGKRFSDDGTILTPEIWNPLTQQWRAVADHSVPRNYHAVALLMPDGRVFSGGGGLCGCSADHADHQVYSPGYLFNADGSLAARPTITDAPDVSTFGMTLDIAAVPDIQRFTMIKMSGTTHAYNTDVRFLNVPFSGNNGNYQLTLESNPNVLTPGYWMLFALNAQGTPSVAKVIQIQSHTVSITNPGSQITEVNESVSLPLIVDNPHGKSLTFNATGLPPGLTIDSTTGVINGIATAEGTYETSATVSNGSIVTDVLFTWTVFPIGGSSNAYRYVRLVADSEVNGNPWTTMAELTVLDGNGTPLNQSGWTLHSVDSEELVGENGDAVNAFDGNPSTFWHTQWSGGNPPPPHEIVIDLGTVQTVSGFRYLPRQDGGENGRIANYRFYGSNDGVTWGAPLATGTFPNTAEEQEVLLAGTRYVRLVADSEVNGNSWTTMAELTVLDGNGTPLNQSGWTLHSVDSEELVGENGDAVNAFDGNAATFWHTQWSGGNPPPPHEIVIDLGTVQTVSGFRYLPRQDGGENGRIADYRFYGSNDGVTWGTPLATGTFANTPDEQQVAFGSTRYVRFVADSEVNGNPWTTVAELVVLDFTGTPLNKNDWILQSVDSEEVIDENAAARNAFDGNPSTIWHTQWATAAPPHPHEIVIGLGGAYGVSGFRYLPRQDGVSNGRVADYRFYGSNDGVTWGTPLATGTFANTPDEQQVIFGGTRYVRLMANSEVNGNPWTTMAELTVLDSTGTPLDKSGWTLRAVDSEEFTGENGAAVNAFDGNPDTIWHTQWSGGDVPYPHEIIIDLGVVESLGGFRYLPRQDGGINGRIGEYQFYGSSDGVTWGVPRASGAFADTDQEQEVLF